MTIVAPKQIGAGGARYGPQRALNAAIDPAQWAIEILLAQQGLKLVKTGDRCPRQAKRSINRRLAVLKVRLLLERARYASLCFLCRLLGDPYQPASPTDQGRRRASPREACAS